MQRGKKKWLSLCVPGLGIKEGKMMIEKRKREKKKTMK